MACSLVSRHSLLEFLSVNVGRLFFHLLKHVLTLFPFITLYFIVNQLCYHDDPNKRINSTNAKSLQRRFKNPIVI